MKVKRIIFVRYTSHVVEPHAWSCVVPSTVQYALGASAVAICLIGYYFFTVAVFTWVSILHVFSPRVIRM